MLLEIDHHSGVPIYRQVIDQIRQLILSGELPQEQQLESVRDLAARLKVNPMTISKAYSLLENEGLLERRRGVGLFIAQVLENKADAKKTEIFRSLAGKAATVALQMGISQEQAIEIFRDCLSEINIEK